jgi:lipoprotein-anchoring transpeptidase ErfK/SrfK
VAGGPNYFIMKTHRPSFPISRRNFLKQTLLGFAGLAIPWKSLVSDTLLENLQEVQAELGRVLKPEIWVYSAPRFSSRKIGRVGMNSLLPQKLILQGQIDPFGNSDWYQIASNLYIHSSGVQNVKNILNPIFNQIPRSGKLAQVTVPYIKGWKDSFTSKKSFIPLFYGSTHWVTAHTQDDDGISFYRIEEDRWGEIYYVPGVCLHIFSEEELKPISPSIPSANKHLEVHLKDQTVVAYENNQPVFHSPMSSGLTGENKDYSTPPGNYEITYKRPSRHMTHSDRIGDADPDLYGVPWVSFFTDTGIAFHGTYWHNEFNYPHSHGCINLPVEAARWIYLWSSPVVPSSERVYKSNHGTTVKVI